MPDSPAGEAQGRALAGSLTGTELDVIAGGSRYLADPALRSVLAGVDRARWDEALEMLAKLAFHVERRHGQDDARIRYAELSR